MGAFLEQYGIAIFVLVIVGIMVLMGSSLGHTVEGLVTQEIKRFTDKSVSENKNIVNKNKNNYGFYFDTKYSAYNEMADNGFPMGEVSFYARENNTLDIYVDGEKWQTFNWADKDGDFYCQTIDATFKTQNNGKAVLIDIIQEDGVLFKKGDSNVTFGNYKYHYFGDTKAWKAFYLGDGEIDYSNAKTRIDGYPVEFYEYGTTNPNTTTINFNANGTYEKSGKVLMSYNKETQDADEYLDSMSEDIMDVDTWFFKLSDQPLNKNDKLYIEYSFKNGADVGKGVMITGEFTGYYADSYISGEATQSGLITFPFANIINVPNEYKHTWGTTDRVLTLSKGIWYEWHCGFPLQNFDYIEIGIASKASTPLKLDNIKEIDNTSQIKISYDTFTKDNIVGKTLEGSITDRTGVTENIQMEIEDSMINEYSTGYSINGLFYVEPDGLYIPIESLMMYPKFNITIK